MDFASIAAYITAAMQGVVFGGITAIAVRLTVRVVGYILAAEFFLLKFLQTYGIIAFDWGRLTGGLLTGGFDENKFAETFSSALLQTGGFGVGFILGYLAVHNRVKMSSADSDIEQVEESVTPDFTHE